MEAKDLMIGDLIKTDGISWTENLKDKYCKITFIGQNYIVSRLIDEPRKEVYGESNSFKPIPLTPEILEKNGWEERPTGYVFYTDGKRYDNSLWYIFDSNTFVVNTTEFQIKYVHQLQHALRLCGINKNIEL